MMSGCEIASQHRCNRTGDYDGLSHKSSQVRFSQVVSYKG